MDALLAVRSSLGARQGLLAIAILRFETLCLIIECHVLSEFNVPRSQLFSWKSFRGFPESLTQFSCSCTTQTYALKKHTCTQYRIIYSSHKKNSKNCFEKISFGSFCYDEANQPLLLFLLQNFRECTPYR